VGTNLEKKTASRYFTFLISIPTFSPPLQNFIVQKTFLFAIDALA
jgi:hypothetical protein